MTEYPKCESICIDPPDKEITAQHLMGLFTYYKRCTIRMKRINCQTSATGDIQMVGSRSEAALKRFPKTGQAVVVTWLRWFPDDLCQANGFWSFLLIYVLRYVFLSGCQYHHFGPKNGEAFLYELSADINNLSYQDHSCRMENNKEKLLFEKCEKNRQTAAETIVVKESNADMLQLWNEDVMFKEMMTSFDIALGHWRLGEVRKSGAHQIIFKNRLFECLSRPEECDGCVSMHALSGAYLRWDEALPRAIGEIYAGVFDDALIALGYENDHEWISHLPLDQLSFKLRMVDEKHPTYLQ